MMPGLPSGLGNLGMVVATLASLFGILRMRRARRGAPEDKTAERRQASALEMERRMASYLASRDLRGGASDDEKAIGQRGER